MNLDLLAKLNQRHAVDRPDQDELEARMASYELAFRMQRQVPDAIDLTGEDAQDIGHVRHRRRRHRFVRSKVFAGSKDGRKGCPIHPALQRHMGQP